MLRGLTMAVMTGLAGITVPAPAGAQDSQICLPQPVEVAYALPMMQIPAGESRTLPVTMMLRARPIPVDVNFLLDTSGSMSSASCAVPRQMQRIVKDLAWRGYDAWVGLGDYQDYPTRWSPSDCPDGIHPYRRRVALGPPGSAFYNAAGSMTYCRDLDDEADSALAALYQSATGEGQFPFIQPGQEARFRAAALRVAVNVTNSAFNNDTRTPLYPGPSFLEAVSALREHTVRQVGIVVDDHVDHHPALADVGRMASETLAVAGKDGAQCSAATTDHHASIPPGKPLVCVATKGMLESTTISGPILELIEEPAEPQGVSLIERRPSGVVSSITPAVHEKVNARAANLLPFKVTFSCGRDDAGRTFDVRLDLRIHDVHHQGDSHHDGKNVHEENRSDPRTFRIRCMAAR